jgi:hypothetical protein
MRDELVIEARGRKVHATYGVKSKPDNVVLWTEARTPEGEFRQCFRQVPVLGKLNRWELAREAERVALRAEAVERGEPCPEGVQFIDMRAKSEGKP